MKTLEEKFKNIHQLSRTERMQLDREIRTLKPDFAKNFYPKFWWWKKCTVDVLIVCDGSLNYHTGTFGLSEFLTTFSELESRRWWINYRVTLAHRGAIVNSTNPTVINHISNFKFNSSVDLKTFDQVWLFGINSADSISTKEILAIESYMNGGGGLFATGDHGSLGSAMCGNIPRVKDMRFWGDTPAGSSNDTNEVSMSGRKRNDTNRPTHGDVRSLFFDNQSDNIPQTIAARTFNAGMPHPLLSISRNQRSSGVIDIMPDHPHEGECKQETTFNVNGVTIPTQIIATSFVLGGSTTSNGNGKDDTDPHCFPSISVWDGRSASVGRIVIDSTWHHFVNVNLNGSGSGADNGVQTGLNDADFEVIRQYYMNIATWVTRRHSIFPCWIKYVLYDLLVNSQIVEANLDRPFEKLGELSLADLNSIGTLTEEILSAKFNPAMAREIMLDLLEITETSLAETLRGWKTASSNKTKIVAKGYYQSWVNLDLLLWTSFGAGFIALRDATSKPDNIDEKTLEKFPDVFQKGMSNGLELSLENLNQSYSLLIKKLNNKGKK